MTPDNPSGAPPDQPLCSLPPDLRAELKEPFGPVETDAEELLERRAGPLVAVGDVVTYHLRTAGRVPDVAVVDEFTERERVEEAVRREVTEVSGPVLEVTNPPASITEPLVCALREGLDRAEPTTILVDGEEDLATLPAILAAPDGASVVYGQPGEGMVHVTVDDAVRTEIHGLLERFEGDSDRLFSLCSA